MKNQLCEYGCNQEAKHQLKNGKWCCSKSPNSCPSIRKKNSNAIKQAHKDGKMRTDQFDGKRGWSKQALLEYEIFEYRCSECGISEWNNQKIVLELDHINGNNRDNRLENLRLMCPNCHSQTDTWRGRNINGKKIVSDEQLINAIKTSKSKHQALIKVGLSAKGGNYARVYRLVEKYHLECNEDTNLNKNRVKIK